MQQKNKTDYSLIYLRSENARMSLKNLSHHLHKSPQLLKYSTAILEKEGIIHDPYYIFDYSYFGLLLFRVYFKAVYIKEQDKLKIIKELYENPSVLSIYELTGEFDLGVEFTAPNPSKFNKEFKKSVSVNPLLKEYKILLNVVTHIYPRHHLTKNIDLQVLNGQKIVGGDREKEEFTPQEMALLKILVHKPIIRYSRLAKEAGLNVKTAKSLLQNLSKRNVVKGCKYQIDTSKLGITKSRLFLKLHNLDTEREALLMEYLNNAREIVQVNKTIGDWDMEIDLETLDKAKIRFMIIKLREEFSDLITSFNVIEFYEYYKKSYLPLYLFKEE